VFETVVEVVEELELELVVEFCLVELVVFDVEDIVVE
jgi:hypothetical protein